jgi:uncharacterized protein YraI
MPRPVATIMSSCSATVRSGSGSTLGAVGVDPSGASMPLISAKDCIDRSVLVDLHLTTG